MYLFCRGSSKGVCRFKLLRKKDVPNFASVNKAKLFRLIIIRRFLNNIPGGNQCFDTGRKIIQVVIKSIDVLAYRRLLMGNYGGHGSNSQTLVMMYWIVRLSTRGRALS